MIEAVMFTFTGSFRPESFVAFVRDRVQRLELESVIRHGSRGEFVVAVAGEPELIGAFEMACSLGPADALVCEVSMQAIAHAELAQP